MTTAMDTDWLEVTDYPANPTTADLEEFFGVPPAPRDELAENIRAKRKHWRKRLQKSRAEDLTARASGVLHAVSEAEDALLRGGTAAGGGGVAAQPEPDRAPASIDDVCRELEGLLFRGRYGEALDRVREYEQHWGEFPRFVDLRSTVVCEAMENSAGVVIAPDLVASAVEGARRVLTQLPPTEARYLTLVDLLELAGKASEIPAVFAQARQRLDYTTAGFRARDLQARFASQPWVEVLRACAELVRESPDDRALRSELAEMIIGRVVAELLPLASEQAVRQYQLAVATAAWIADGVPAAEDLVRVHRMWASNADQPVFAGNWQWRAFAGLITFFIALPLLNSAMAKPAWQVLLSGPVLGETAKRRAAVAAQNRAWHLVTRNLYVMPVHGRCTLPWQDKPGEWPEVDAGKLFNF